MHPHKTLLPPLLRIVQSNTNDNTDEEQQMILRMTGWPNSGSMKGSAWTKRDAYANTQFEFDLTQQTKETYIKTQAQSLIEAYTKI